MKNLILILAAVSMGAAPMLDSLGSDGSESNKKVDISFKQGILLGKEAIAQVRAGYEKGEYDAFLKELDDQFHQAQAKNALDPFNVSRPSSTSLEKKWDEKVRALEDKKKQALLEMIGQSEGSILVEKIRSVVSNLESEKEQAAIDRIVALQFLPQGSGTNNDEKLLVGLECEYAYKAAHIDLPNASSLEKRQKLAALRMEKLDVMKQVSGQFQDASLKEAIAIYTERFDDRLAQGWDAADLTHLANGAWKPSNPLEEKVVSVLQDYQEKLREMIKDFIADHS